MTAATESSDSADVSPASVLGIGIGLLIVVAGFALLLLYGSRTFAAREELARKFDLGEFAHDFALEEKGFLLPGGERVYVISDGTPDGQEQDLGTILDPGEDPLQEGLDAEVKAGEELQDREADGDAQVDDSHGGDSEFTEWSAMEVLSTDSPPNRIYLAHYPVARAEEVIGRQFLQLDWKQLSTIDKSGGRAVVEGGEIRWGGYEANFVRERNFIEGGSFRDTLRVNLSVDTECWVAYATWPTSHAGSKEPVAELLAALQPIE